MKQFVFLLICIASLSGRAAAQTLTDCTISSCCINAEMLTGVAGEACAVSLAGDETGLTPGFIEVLLSEAVNVPDDPADEEPTSVDQMEQPVKITIEGHRLRVNCSRPCELTVYNLSGNSVVRKKIDMESIFVLPSSVYIVVLKDQMFQNVYKINIRD